MNFNLINGIYSEEEARELITKLVQIKIKFQENRIREGDLLQEEDIKRREKRIIELQNYLKKCLDLFENCKNGIDLTTTIEISPHLLR